jgi:hypothetical protein
LLDIATDSQDTNSIKPLQVVADIEFVEVQGDVEGGKARGEEGSSDEGDCEIGTVDRSYHLFVELNLEGGIG